MPILFFSINARPRPAAIRRTSDGFDAIRCGGPTREDSVARSVIPLVAARLMEATAATVTQVHHDVLAQLVEHLDIDVAFLRHNDHQLGVSRLVAVWPPRRDDAEPDAITVAAFGSTDPVMALCERGKKPVVVRADPKQPYYQSWIDAGRRNYAVEARNVAASSVAAAPLVSEGVTTGLLGCVKYRRRRWKATEINTLEVVAALFAQLQARVAAEEKLRDLADHDDLTGLHNRRALIAHLSHRLAAGRPGPVPVLFFDLDRLKSINDYLGHGAGDWYIRTFAEKLQAQAGRQNMIARLGGDEFVVVPDGAMPIDRAEKFADQLWAAVCDRLTIAGQMVFRTVSVGVAVGVPGRDNSSDLLHHADEAVLTAKRNGGNQVAIANEDMSINRIFRNDIELHLPDGIDNNAFLLEYLPEVDLWTGAIVGVEALIRWQHPKRGLLLPASFIAVAESTHSGGRLGRWILRQACAEFSRWRSKGLGANTLLRINVSPMQLAAPDFAGDVATIVDEFGLDCGSMCLEITERAVAHDIDSARRTLEKLKDVGVQIAIDDFGTGYAVLSQLKSLPVDALKIDRCFVRDLGTNDSDLAIVRAIIGLADAFGLQVVAEGVETSAAALRLLRNGCHCVQGFLLSRPVGSAGMESLLRQRWMPMPFLADSQALSVSAI
jgi:diguanylate cyclase (GGDEF)-like protein